MMELKIQESWDSGKTWVDTMNCPRSTNFDKAKEYVGTCRKCHPDCQYRIVGREIMPWCEIKEGEVK